MPASHRHGLQGYRTVENAVCEPCASAAAILAAIVGEAAESTRCVIRLEQRVACRRSFCAVNADGCFPSLQESWYLAICRQGGNAFQLCFADGVYRMRRHSQTQTMKHKSRPANATNVPTHNHLRDQSMAQC
jgi:hypothetical protein